MQRRRLPGSLAALVTALAVLAVLAAGYFIGRWRTRREAVSSAPVVQAMRRIARLATVEMEIADVVRYEEVKTILVFDFPKNATLRLRGKVTGGFDLDHGFDVKADAARHRIVVSLPAPQILSIDDRLEWFDEQSGWLNPITPADRTRWTQWARAALSRAAKDAGLHEKSTAHARDLFTDAAAAFGWSAEVMVGGTRVLSVPPATPAAGSARP